MLLHNHIQTLVINIGKKTIVRDGSSGGVVTNPPQALYNIYSPAATELYLSIVATELCLQSVYFYDNFHLTDAVVTQIPTRLMFASTKFGIFGPSIASSSAAFLCER